MDAKPERVFSWNRLLVIETLESSDAMGVRLLSVNSLLLMLTVDVFDNKNREICHTTWREHRECQASK